jgi:nucleoside-diphosphate-sugar epimerase
MRVLVTGATGFIGSRLVGYLLEAGHTVAILKRAKSDLNSLAAVKEKILVFTADTYNDINNGIKQFMPDVVIHLAALYINKHTSENIADLINSNITFGTYILEAMTENRVTKLVNIGTRWQHLENKRYNPANLYAATKEAFKNILVYYETIGITYKTIELCDTYGVGDTRKKILDILMTACLHNEPVDLSPGEQVLDLSCVDDICVFITQNVSSQSFFDNKTVSLSGTVIKLYDLGVMIEKQFTTPGILNWGGKSYRDHEVMNPPGYYQKIILDKKHSLTSYIRWCCDNKYEIIRQVKI